MHQVHVDFKPAKLPCDLHLLALLECVSTVSVLLVYCIKAPGILPVNGLIHT